MKEEFWHDKTIGQENLVKMGKIENFRVLQRSNIRPETPGETSEFIGTPLAHSITDDELY